MQKANPKSKYRYWWAVLYPENMVENWEDIIGDKLQLPYAYCIHNMDNDKLSNHRKDHVHLILAWPGPTTYKNAMDVFSLLNAEEKKAVNTCENCISIRHCYEYLIHNTDDCKKAGKEQYEKEMRKEGNNFDIGAYEQQTENDKMDMVIEIDQIIVDNHFYNFMHLRNFILQNRDRNYYRILVERSGYFERMCKGVYLDINDKGKTYNELMMKLARQKAADQERRDKAQDSNIVAWCKRKGYKIINDEGEIVKE